MVNSLQEIRSGREYDIMSADNPDLAQKLFSLWSHDNDPDWFVRIIMRDPDDGQVFELVLARVDALLRQRSREGIVHFNGTTTTGMILNGWYNRPTEEISSKIGAIRVSLQP